MASMGLLGYAVMALFSVTMVLAVGPIQAQASLRGSSGIKLLNDGLCASFITNRGYKCDEHEVTTKDGFILSLQRIPEGRTNGSNNGAKKPPVLVQHGVMVGGMSWVLNPPNENLPMSLADSGFDVWIANGRGTIYSQRHKLLHPTEPAFWDWTFDDVATNDIPAMFDYVYNQTGQKVHYVGHSMGTLVALLALAERNEVVLNRMKSAALLSPIAYLSHITTAITEIAAKTFIGEMTAASGTSQFDPNAITVVTGIKAICDSHRINCDDMMTAISGSNCCLNSSSVNLFMAHLQPTATKNLIHFSQIIRFGEITKFNYELPDLNIKNYGSLFPPRYDLTKIPSDIPLFMSYGGNDALSDVTDVLLLLDILKSHDLDKLSVQFIKDYAHADYVIGYNAKEVVYDYVIAFFKKTSIILEPY